MRPPELSKLKPGEHYIYRFLDENGERELTPWGLPISDLKIKCVKFDEVSKALYWDYLSFIDFIFDSLECGISTDKFDLWMYDKTGVRAYVLKPIQHKPERYKLLQEKRLNAHRNSVLSVSDLDFYNQRVDHFDIKIGELRQKSKMAVLARLDPEFRESFNQNITGNIAQIILPKKDEESDSETLENS